MQSRDDEPIQKSHHQNWATSLSFASERMKGTDRIIAMIPEVTDIAAHLCVSNKGSTSPAVPILKSMPKNSDFHF